MEQYIDFSGQGGFEVKVEDANEHDAQQLHTFQQNLPAYTPDHSKPAYINPNLPPQMSCDVKPRLTKEQHDILERHFEKQHKPNTIVKKNYAEKLGVSLDKVNNWFQNRRAKSKHDAKKQQGAINLFPQQGNLSDAEPSPTYPTATSEYATMSQQWSAEQELPNGLGVSGGSQYQDQVAFHDLAASNGFLPTDQYQEFAMPSHMPEDIYESPLEQNRRTLTQENFNAMAMNGGMMHGSGDFEDFNTGFSGNQDMMNQVFPELQNDFKRQDVFAFPHPVEAPLSSNDSTIPSNVSEQSFQSFPTSSSMRPQVGVSANSSEWGDSRSSSLHEGAYLHMATTHQDQHAVPTSQWQPGTSKPVDVAALNEEFRVIAQARASDQQHEQPLAFPDDEAFTRRESQASLLAQSLGNVGIQTPHPQQSATFKSPPPASSIAARRQRPKPAPIGLGPGSVRSQSYSAHPQPGSPGQVQQQPSGSNVSLPLRRIRSSQAIGNVAPGRVMKSIPGSAQRSPLNLTFNDALNSPQAIRHASLQSQSLAPPTPMSPGEFFRAEQSRQMSQYPAAPSHVNRQPSISEHDYENSYSNAFPYQPTGPVPAQNFTSPPHTPQYYQQQFVTQRLASNIITENTPPQSAPASQTCFPSNVFAVQQMQPHPAPQQQMQPIAMAHPPIAMNGAVPDQQYQGPNVTFVPAQHANVSPSAPTQGLPYHFANGVPVVNAAGDIQMAFPSNMQFMQQQQQQMQGQTQQMQASPQVNYPFISSSGPSDAQANSQTSKPSTDFFVHEYTPPDSIKRAATPRKPVDSGPKSFTFSHTSMDHFESKRNKKSDKDASIGSSSPASSSAS